MSANMKMTELNLDDSSLPADLTGKVAIVTGEFIVKEPCWYSLR